MSKDSEVSQTFVGFIEKGRNVSVDTIVKILKVLL